MGVKGLTSYIARYAEQYLMPYELHDCNLVIDGDCLACNLYKDYSGAYSAFGGDYDDFYRAVINFFNVLTACNIKPYVLMDGGYEKRKLRSVGQRMRGKISVIKRINPCGSQPIFPLMLKEVFISAIKACNVPIMRCIFEADQELATLSRKLNCPVLSYDSDFYIYNVLYIPLVTLTLKIHTKIIKGNKTLVEEGRKLKHTEARHLQKLINRQQIMHNMEETPLNNTKSKNNYNNNNNNSKNKNEMVSYKFLDCCIYRIEHFIKLDQEKLPLFAALLGNDYISRSSCLNTNISGIAKMSRSHKTNAQQRRIRTIINWLKYETYETALTKVLQRLSKNKQAQLLAAMKSYSDEMCHSYDFFSNSKNTLLQDKNQFNCSLRESLLVDESSEDEIANEIDEINEFEVLNCIISSNNDNSQSDNEASTIEMEEKCHNGDVNDNDVSHLTSTTLDEYHQKNINRIGALRKFPKWFLDKLYAGHFPRFFVDFLHLHKYINNPQIEHYAYNDSNEVALPILLHTFTLLSNATARANVQQDNLHNAHENENENESENENENIIASANGRKSYFTYLTRQARVTNIHYKVYELEELPKCYFKPFQPDPLLLRKIYQIKMPELCSEQLFNTITDLPKDLQLYFLSIVYWLQKSQHCDLIHLHALILCVVVLRTIDSTIPAERNLNTFKKRFSKIIQRERQVRNEQKLRDGCKRQIRKNLLELPIPERMTYIPKSDCYLVQYNLLKYFYMPEIFKKKYDLYSTIVLHAFAEFQAILYQIHSLNVLLDFVYDVPQLHQLYCGVFLYNLYELLKSRSDPFYYIENFLLQDSQMMYDFYQYLWSWCYKFVPSWKKSSNMTNNKPGKRRNSRNKQKSMQQKQEAYALHNNPLNNPATEITQNQNEKVNHKGNDNDNDNDNDNSDKNSENEDDDFYDVNNKFCTFLKITK